MSLERLLIIEDNEKHLADAKQYMQDKGLEVVYATTYEEAKEHYETVDAVISDIYFPERKEEYEQACGVKVAEDLEGKTPFVLLTAGYHHGDKYSEIFELAYQKSWIIVETDSLEVPETDTGIDFNYESPRKRWEEAYISLLELEGWYEEAKKEAEKTIGPKKYFEISMNVKFNKQKQ